MAKHKWHKEIKHWADGGQIEIRYRIWLDAGGFQWSKWTMEPRIPNWELTDCEYRIKPQPKEPQYLYVYTNSLDQIFFRPYSGGYGIEKYIGKIKLEFEE